MAEEEVTVPSVSEGDVYRASPVHTEDSPATQAPADTPPVAVVGSGSGAGITLPEVSRARRVNVPYSDELVDIILDHYTEGQSLHQISKIEGMPSYASIIRWSRDVKRFRELLAGARAARALHFEERALAVADEVLTMEDKDRAAVARLQFDIHRWGAEVNDAAQYGKKTTISGDASKPIVFQIVTGVPEPQEKAIQLDNTGLVQEVIEVQSEVIGEQTEHDL